MAKNFNFYCDTLSVGQDAKISPEKVQGKDQWFTIRIFARKIEARSTLSVNLAPMTELLIYTPGIAAMLNLQLTLPNMQSKIVTPNIEPGRFGISFTVSDKGDKVEEAQLPPPRAQLQNINYMDLINEDGTLKSKEYLNEYAVSFSKI